MLLFIIGKICVYFPSLCAAIFAQFGFTHMKRMFDLPRDSTQNCRHFGLKSYARAEEL